MLVAESQGDELAGGGGGGVNQTLKGQAQAKIIKKSVILFWLTNMTIWCKHVHRLELQSFF